MIVIDKLMVDYATTLVTFAVMLWREARGEPAEGKRAVANVVLNRVARPGWWGHSIYDVIVKSDQFSSMTATGDMGTKRWPKIEDPQFEECFAIAHAAMDNVLSNPAPGADHYYAVSIPPPKWADESKFVCQIGNHRFYNLVAEPKPE
jgi:spore germination cell wall hydrolase CwlJ-like protein